MIGDNSTSGPDRYAQGVLDARLGRPPRDVIEATIVLEAWAGRPARTAMTTARELVTPDAKAASLAKGRLEKNRDREQQSVVMEGIALIFSILSVASWATPLSREVGPHVLAQAIRLALPVSFALQWGLRSRYLSRRSGLALFARDWIACCAFALIAVELPLALVANWGPIAAMLVAIWTGGTVLVRRGWGLLYAAALGAGTLGFERHEPAHAVLGALTAFVLLTSAAAVITRRAQTDEQAGGVPRALTAALLGICVGVLLVADPSVGWGVHGIHPAIALVPSVIGSLWGGYYLWNFHEAIPRGLSGVPLHRASRIGLKDPAMSIFLGALVRLVIATIVLSAVVIYLGRFTRGTDQLSVFIAFGFVALVSLLIGLLETLSLQRAALIAVTAAVGAELAWRSTVHWHVSGGALIAGAAVGVILTLVPILALLARSGRVLATTLWIQ